MRAATVLCLVFLVTGTVKSLRLKTRTSQWRYQTVRRLVDLSIIVDSVVSRTLVGCASYCSNVDSILVPSLYFKPDTGQCSCNSENDDGAEDEDVPEMLYGTRRTLLQEDLFDDSIKKITVWPYKSDCFALSEDSYTENGVYVISPYNGYVTDSWCDMSNGGWTVIQRRMDGSKDFNRGWNDYVTGFGSRKGDHWIGLETIHQLTKNDSALHVYIDAHPGVIPTSMTAQYSHFEIRDSASNYALNISGFSGSCGDSLAYHNGRSFSTLDNDNDGRSWGSCAVASTGGWWFHNCHYSNLNGRYFEAGQYQLLPSNNGTGIHWYTCWMRQASAKFVVMKIRPF